MRHTELNIYLIKPASWNWKLQRWCDACRLGLVSHSSPLSPYSHAHTLVHMEVQLLPPSASVVDQTSPTKTLLVWECIRTKSRPRLSLSEKNNNKKRGGRGVSPVSYQIYKYPVCFWDVTLGFTN